MKKYILILFSFYSFISCNEKIKEVEEKSNSINQNLIVSKNKISENLSSTLNDDTLTINSKCAVIYSPTEKSIEKSKKDVDEENFYVGADDFLFYISKSSEYLESKNIKIVTTENDKILKFISENKITTLINLDLEKELFVVYLFDPKQHPKKINITAISDEFESYMK